MRETCKAIIKITTGIHNGRNIYRVHKPIKQQSLCEKDKVHLGKRKVVHGKNKRILKIKGQSVFVSYETSLCTLTVVGKGDLERSAWLGHSLLFLLSSYFWILT